MVMQIKLIVVVVVVATKGVTSQQVLSQLASDP